MLENNPFAGMDFEVKNRKTGKIYWLSKKGVDELRKQGMLQRYIVSEIRALKTITSPLDFKIEKKDEPRRKESIK